MWQVRRIVYDSAVVADPAQYQDPAGSDSGHPSLPILSCCVVTPCWRTSGSSLRSFPPWGRHRSRVRVFWVQSPRFFRTQWEPPDRRTGWLGHQSRSPRDTVIRSPARKRCHLRLRQGHQSSIVWGLQLPPQPREQWHRSHPFRAGAGRGARHRPYSDSRKKSGKFSAASLTRQRWWFPGGGSPGRLCPALAESAGQLPGLRLCRGRGGQCIPATTSAHPSVHQLPDQKQPSGPPTSHRCLTAEGRHRAVHQRDLPRVLQQVVPGPKEDRRSAACNWSLLSQPPLGSSTLQDGDARVCPFRHQKSGVDGIDRHLWCLPSCSDAPGRPQVSTLRGQQASVPVHWSPLWVSDFSTRVHQAAAARRSAVKAARYEATRLLRRLADQSRYSGTGQTARPDDHQCAPVSWLDHQLREVRPRSKSGLFQFVGMQFNTWQFTVVPYRRCVTRSSPFISTGLLTRTSQPGIYTGFSACWCSWLRWYDGEDFVFVRSSGGPPQHCARVPGAGPTGSKFLSGFCQSWPGGHLQQSCKVYPSPPRRRKWLSSRMRPVRAGEPS